MKITHPDQLARLRDLRGLQVIQVEADAFLAGNLPLYLFKYVAWALAEGGSAEVRATRTLDSMGIIPGAWPFQMLVQVACKAIEGIGILTKVDVATRTFSFVRTSAPPEREPWSAVVVYSGREAELPLLDQCLRGLLDQPELTEGGQIAVCGPVQASGVVQPYPGVEYLPCETPTTAGRFLVGKKKNFAIQHMRHERVLVCHSRIILEKGCLGRIPTEFDLITPRVSIIENNRSIPYVDLFFHRLESNTCFTAYVPPSLGYPRKDWMRFLRSHYPFVDGGLFCIKKSLALSVPISESIAWGEGEDLEWCRRLLMEGRVLELCINAGSVSLVDKSNLYSKWGQFPGFCAVRVAVRNLQAFFRRF